MNNSSLLSNGYNPYANYNNDILSLVDNEKKKYDKIKNKKEKSIFSTDINEISDEVILVISKSFEDIFHRNDYKKLFQKDRWRGISYICIIISLAYYINRFS